MKMVERMARAMCLAENGPEARHDHDVWKYNARAYEDLAMAALIEIRKVNDGDFGGNYGTAAQKQFEEMIDAAIKEAESE